jgi:hypothetical protein
MVLLHPPDLVRNYAKAIVDHMFSPEVCAPCICDR